MGFSVAGRPGEGVSACVAEALSLIRSRAYFAGRVDWSAIDREISWLLADGADLAEAMRPVWRALGDGHSHLRPACTPPTSQLACLPAGRQLPLGLGYLRLPAFGGWYRSSAAINYVQAVWAWLREDPAGWVIDLRGNGGGSAVPMLAAVGPLLGAGQWLTYRRRDGSSQPYRYQTGQLSIGPHQVLVADSPPADTPALPVAVLIDRRTASAAEAVLVAFHGRSNTRSFGESTSGVPTGNVCHRLSDGSLLAITESVAIDRTGRAYTTAIAPDLPGGRLPAAHAWLRSQLSG